MMDFEHIADGIYSSYTLGRNNWFVFVSICWLFTATALSKFLSEIGAFISFWETETQIDGQQSNQKNENNLNKTK